MKKIYLLLPFFMMAVFAIAQTPEIDDDFESYPVGQPILQDHWTDWGCSGGTPTAGCNIMASSDQAFSGSVSGLIPDDGATDAVLDLGNKIFGEWGLSFEMYVPSGKEAYFNLQGVVPVTSGQWIIGNIFFNQDGAAPGQGYIDWSTFSDTSDDTYFSFPHDQWFTVIFNFDITAGITAATFSMYVDGNEVVAPGTPLADGEGNYPDSLGGIDFFSISANNLYYLDDVYFVDAFIPVSVEDLDVYGFESYPNPVEDVLNLKADKDITSVSINNILGQKVYDAQIEAKNAQIDMSSFDSGLYFVTVTIGDSTGTIKVIK